MLVSEVMAQQTQVERVVPYFRRFMNRFPTVEALATAPLGAVLEVWSGLGYNSRARRLHEAAGRIAAEGWPASIEALEGLPGVGVYTARAVACFALDVDVVPVDTNLRRVLSRWHGEALRGPALQAAADNDSLGTAPSEWAQAVMDLGSLVCKPQSPLCETCPVSAWCPGPDAYEPPRPQPRFEGSTRQVRGAIVRCLVAGPASAKSLATQTGFDIEHVRQCLGALERERMVDDEDGVFRIAGG